MRSYIQTRLGLQTLETEDSFYISSDALMKERSTLMSLKTYADKVRESPMSGLSVYISDRFGIGHNGALYIKWDFTTGDMERLLIESQTKNTPS